MCLYGYAHVSVCDLRSPEAEVTDSWEPLGTELGLLQEQPVLLTTEVSSVPGFGFLIPSLTV